MSPATTKITLPNGTSYEQPTGLFINNEFVSGSSKNKIEVTDPNTGKSIIEVEAASVEDVDRAVAAARAAFEGDWSSVPAIQRGALLYKLADLVARDRELLAAIDAFDNGKPYGDALAVDLDEAINVFRYYAGWADKIFGKTIETSPEKLAYILQEPLGVCAQIIPWNFPMMILAWKVAPAIACGNSVIVKPAEQTPLSALYFGKLVQEAEAPAGLINILPGHGGEAGAALAGHLDVDKVSFTGSTATGRNIMRAASSNLKNVTLECGGKSPLIVFADANLEQAVKWSHVGGLFNQGEVCTSTSRIYVEDSIYDKFVELFVKEVKAASKVGAPFDDGTFQGPQVSRAQFDKVMKYIDIGKQEGAKVEMGGSKVEGDGYFIQPTIFTNVEEGMKIMTEEIFGPVVAIGRFTDEKDAIRKANNSSYGLAAAVFTENMRKGHKVAAKLAAGMVWINSSGDSHFGIPFGGYKSSGIGKDLGPYALDSYTQAKAVHVNLGVDL
ncbi:aldehyde dehydrogenase domain-containing protein [Neohortaea acidophila]|uniref:aldehyde dehydrogenase (NAD(+)) n=1 Tax=Neohortaea acidophila TaxID=245834 RepID=A0A6A6Q6B9_9PEZI|nr:aldehyde dehydrogenase domain-containing protein [Neohortaea acidophila]KAF2487183.1 aldehyde dehydrogenase domain-containing protein [Neohortaea acidophila]